MMGQDQVGHPWDDSDWVCLGPNGATGRRSVISMWHPGFELGGLSFPVAPEDDQYREMTFLWRALSR